MGLDQSGKPWMPKGMQLDPDATAALHDGQGYPAAWEKAAPCPRRIDNDQGKHDFNCTICENAFGIRYYGRTTTAPGTDKDLLVLVSSISFQEQLRPEGPFGVGSALISVPKGCKPDYFDRFTLLGSRIRASEVLQRGTGAVDKLKWPSVTQAEGGIEYVVDHNGTEYVVGTDVQLNGAGNVEWIGATPAKDLNFTVIYYRLPTYIVIEVPHQVRDSMYASPTPDSERVLTDFGGQVVCKLDYLVKPESLR